MEEKLVCFDDVYRNRRVLITGHTGFKGSWLCHWLKQLGAEVAGVSLPVVLGELSHFNLLQPDVASFFADIRDLNKLTEIIQNFNPEIIFHLAAQALVIPSFQNPVGTFGSNVMGTVNLLSALSAAPACRAVVAVTSDKCYDNNNSGCAFAESDPLGGSDPYSASKGAAALIIKSWRESFYPVAEYGVKHHVLIADARAGNVIGGGDWGKYRLLPDLMRSAADGREETLRCPEAVRPFQFVLEPLAGYLELGKRLFAGEISFSGAWNFGPEPDGVLSVRQLAEIASKVWPEVRFRELGQKTAFREAKLLYLDSSKARNELGLGNVWSGREAVTAAVNWYRNYYSSGKLDTQNNLQCFMLDALQKGASWIKGGKN